MNGYLAKSSERYLLNLYNNQVKSLLEIRSKDGLWHTILTDPTSYTETSGSAGIIAGILLGVKSDFPYYSAFSRGNQRFNLILNS